MLSLQNTSDTYPDGRAGEVPEEKYPPTPPARRQPHQSEATPGRYPRNEVRTGLQRCTSTRVFGTLSIQITSDTYPGGRAGEVPEDPDSSSTSAVRTKAIRKRSIPRATLTERRRALPLFFVVFLGEVDCDVVHYLQGEDMLVGCFLELLDFCFRVNRKTVCTLNKKSVSISSHTKRI